MNHQYFVEPGKQEDRYTWIYCVDTDERNQAASTAVYLVGTAGRVRIRLAHLVCDALNEFSLCCGEGR